MAFRTRRNSRRRTKKPIEQKKLVGEGFFIGLDFVTRISEIVDSVESFAVNPNILFKGDSVLVDYGDALKGKKRIRDEIQTFFEATAVKGDTLTCTNGEFLDERTGDPTTYNLSGTYTFESFNPNTLIALLTKVSVNNESSTYSRYDKDFFINGSLQWTTSSSTQENKTEQINSLVNRIGKHSVNSFYSIFKRILPNDTLDIKIGSNISSYTVSSYYVDAENMEHIELVEDVPTDTTLFGSEVFVILRRKEIEESRNPSLPPQVGVGMGGGSESMLPDSPSRTTSVWVCCNPTGSPAGHCVTDKTFNEDDCIGEGGTWTESNWLGCNQAGICEGEVETAVPNQNEVLDLVKSAQETLTHLQNRNSTLPRTSTANSSMLSNLQTAKEKWQQSGKKTLNVSIETDSKGTWSYVINGKTKPTLELDAGKTYRFNISHISNGIKGFTNMSHEFTIVGENGENLAGNHTYSTSKMGSRGAYVYFTIPTNRITLKYVCKERTVEGSTIKVIMTREQKRQISYKPTAKPKHPGWVCCHNDYCDTDLSVDKYDCSGMGGRWVEGDCNFGCPCCAEPEQKTAEQICNENPNTHWMAGTNGNSGYCMQGASHSTTTQTNTSSTSNGTSSTSNGTSTSGGMSSGY